MPAGSEATIEKRGTPEEVILDFNIPRGDPGTGESGTGYYEDLENKPRINNMELIGNKTLKELGIQPEGNYASIEEIPKKVSELANDSGYLSSIPDSYKTKAENDGYYQPKGNYLIEEEDPTVPVHVKNITEQNIADWNNKSNFSGSYEDLANKPEIPQGLTVLESNSTAPLDANNIMKPGVYILTGGNWENVPLDALRSKNDGSKQQYIMFVQGTPGTYAEGIYNGHLWQTLIVPSLSGSNYVPDYYQVYSRTHVNYSADNIYWNAWTTYKNIKEDNYKSIYSDLSFTYNGRNFIPTMQLLFNVLNNFIGENLPNNKENYKLEKLQTTNKTSLINAINELKTEIDTLKGQ